MQDTFGCLPINSCRNPSYRSLMDDDIPSQTESIKQSYRENRKFGSPSESGRTKFVVQQNKSYRKFGRPGKSGKPELFRKPNHQARKHANFEEVNFL